MKKKIIFAIFLIILAAVITGVTYWIVEILKNDTLYSIWLIMSVAIGGVVLPWLKKVSESKLF